MVSTRHMFFTTQGPESRRQYYQPSIKLEKWTSVSPWFPAFGWAFSMKTLYDLFYNFQLQNSLTDMGYTVRAPPSHVFPKSERFYHVYKDASGFRPGPYLSVSLVFSRTKQQVRMN